MLGGAWRLVCSWRVAFSAVHSVFRVRKALLAALFKAAINGK